MSCQDDCYNVCSYIPLSDLGLTHSQVVLGDYKFDRDGQVVTIAKPDPQLLALHASCARVCHRSGAAEYIDKIVRDIEEVGVLAHDGHSADLLYNALLSRVNTAVLAH